MREVYNTLILREYLKQFESEDLDRLHNKFDKEHFFLQLS